MKTILPVFVFLLFTAGSNWGVATVPGGLRLAKKQDSFFVENDFVYTRFLQLSHDGSYRQINREGNSAAEIDWGTWEQDGNGTVLLHFTQGGMRYRALLSGPLAMLLDHPQNFNALPNIASAVRRWLVQSNATVFPSASLRELDVSPFALSIESKAETFRRQELETLAQQIDDFSWSEEHRTYVLNLVKPIETPMLLIQHHAVFQLPDLVRVLQEYPVTHGHPPPFYFAQVDARTFAVKVGTWQAAR